MRGREPLRAPVMSVRSTLRLEAPRFARYLAVGLVSFGVDVSVFASLVSGTGMDPLLAHLVSRPLGGLACFFLHRAWTFAATGPVAGQLARFACVFGASLALTEGLLALAVRGLGMPAVGGKVLAEGTAVLFNFLALRFFTFRPSETR